MSDPAPGSGPVPAAAAPQRAADRVGVRLGTFAAVLVVVLAAAFGIGRLVDTRTGPPPAAAPQPAHQQHTDPQHSDPQHSPGELGAAGAPAADGHRHDVDAAQPGGQTAGAGPAVPGGPAGTVGGLAISAAGLTLVPASTTFVAGRAAPLRFRIVDARARPVTTFAVVHDKPLHLVVVRRDLSGYQHLHPTMAADGTWTAGLGLPAAGSWRAYADFTAVVDGRQTPATLGVDLNVAGAYAPQGLPAATRTDTPDGFTVTYQGAPRVGATQPLLVRVSRDGSAAALQPYLGAYGHLVVLREGDLGYVHVHPEPQLAEGAVKFWLAAPGPGRYRMFFDFQVAGRVHTAAFTTTVS